MAKRSFSDKAARTMRLLHGLREPTIMDKLSRYGFDEAELARGWALLQATGTVRHARKPPPVDHSATDALEQWQSQWFTVVDATLTAHFPQIAEELSRDLPPGQGPEMAVTVRMLLDRINRMGAGIAPYGPDGQQARALIEKRGFTDEVMQQGAKLVDDVKAAKDAPEIAPLSTDPTKIAEAEEAMWGFYLEWGRIARIALTSRRELRKLGFLKSKSSKHDDAETTTAPAPHQSGTHVIEGVTSDKEVANG